MVSVFYSDLMLTIIRCNKTNMYTTTGTKLPEVRLSEGSSNQAMPSVGENKKSSQNEFGSYTIVSFTIHAEWHMQVIQYLTKYNRRKAALCQIHFRTWFMRFLEWWKVDLHLARVFWMQWVLREAEDFMAQKRMKGYVELKRQISQKILQIPTVCFTWSRHFINSKRMNSSRCSYKSNILTYGTVTNKNIKAGFPL